MWFNLLITSCRTTPLLLTLAMPTYKRRKHGPRATFLFVHSGAVTHSTKDWTLFVLTASTLFNAEIFISSQEELLYLKSHSGSCSGSIIFEKVESVEMTGLIFGASMKLPSKNGTWGCLSAAWPVFHALQCYCWWDRSWIFDPYKARDLKFYYLSSHTVLRIWRNIYAIENENILHSFSSNGGARWKFSESFC